MAGTSAAVQHQKKQAATLRLRTRLDRAGLLGVRVEFRQENNLEKIQTEIR